MKVVVALGGNALLKRGEPMTARDDLKKERPPRRGRDREDKGDKGEKPGT